MFQSAKILSRLSCLGAVAMMALAGLMTPQAQARPLPPPTTMPPPKAGCTCGDLEVTSSNIFGNVWIGDDGSFIGSTADGPGTVTGTVLFNGLDTIPPSRFNPDGVIVTGGSVFDTNVQNDINNFNRTSPMLGGESGTSLTINGGGSRNASDGVPDGAGNRVFTATIGNFPALSTFTIIGDGTGTQTVVVNIGATGSVSFDGSIILEGGLTPDQVLFNFFNNPALTIDTTPPIPILTASVSAAVPATAGTTTGTFLDPFGSIILMDSVVDGSVLGGATPIPGSTTIDFLIKDSTILPSEAPEPTSLALLGVGVVAFGIIRRRHRLLARP